MIFIILFDHPKYAYPRENEYKERNLDSQKVDGEHSHLIFEWAMPSSAKFPASASTLPISSQNSAQYSPAFYLHYTDYSQIITSSIWSLHGEGQESDPLFTLDPCPRAWKPNAVWLGHLSQTP